MSPVRSALCAALLCLLAVPAAAEQLVGRSRVIDGDTIVVGGIAVRLEGIAASEVARGNSPGERGGTEAAAFMERVAGAEPQCASSPRSGPGDGDSVTAPLAAWIWVKPSCAPA